MLLSMTGYGSAETIIREKKIKVAIKALNGKLTDVRIKLPTMFKELEMIIRKRVLDQTLRGKLDLSITIDSSSGEDEFSLNTVMLNKYLKELKSFNQEANLDLNNIMPTLFQFPNVFSTKVSDLVQSDIELLYSTIDEAIKDLMSFRQQEGDATIIDFNLRIKNMMEALTKIEPFEIKRIELLRARIESRMNELNSVEVVDQNRFEQELLYYIEKLDISEEKTRLEQHTKYFIEVLNDSDPK